MSKVILISIDGMRSDAFLECGNPFAEELMKLGSHCIYSSSVMPSVTLPCHMSIFHSAPPDRHGIITNTYTPMVRPIDGLFEVAKQQKKVCAMYYGWEPLRDVARPGSLKYSAYVNAYTEEGTDGILTDLALDRIEKSKPDFVFLYMVETDEKGGHKNGWMSDEYLRYVRTAIDNVKRVYEAAGEEYTIIITADHGGIGRGHGMGTPECMNVPTLYIGERFTPGKAIEGLSIIDLAPTIADILDLPIPEDWEGKSVANEK